MKVFNLEIMLHSDYKEIERELEKVNKNVNLVTAERNQKINEIVNLKKEKTKLEKVIANDKAIFEEKDELIKKTEESRKSSASKVGGYVKENHKLKTLLDEKNMIIQTNKLQYQELEKQYQDLQKQFKDEQDKNKKLEKINGFLKNHRRAPNIEEIKNYEEHRKISNCKKAS